MTSGVQKRSEHFRDRTTRAEYMGRDHGQRTIDDYRRTGGLQGARSP